MKAHHTISMVVTIFVVLAVFLPIFTMPNEMLWPMLRPYLLFLSSAFFLCILLWLFPHITLKQLLVLGIVSLTALFIEILCWHANSIIIPLFLTGFLGLMLVKRKSVQIQ